MENLRLTSLTETPRPLLKNRQKFGENSRFIEAFVTHYKNFRDPEIGEKVSDHLKAMVVKTNYQGLLHGMAILVPGGR